MSSENENETDDLDLTCGDGCSSTGKSTESAPREELKETIGKKEQRKLHARREGRQSPWFGLGMFGLVGWSVALPTLLGVVIGTWIDRRWPSQISWTLMLMFCGVAIGAINAWYWINKESS